MKIEAAGISTKKEVNRLIGRHIFIVTYPNNKLLESICLSSRVKVWKYLNDIGRVHHCLHSARPGLNRLGPPVKSYWSFTRQIIEGNHFRLVCLTDNGPVFVELNKYPLL
jgi:hypothetical protein